MLAPLMLLLACSTPPTLGPAADGTPDGQADTASADGETGGADGVDGADGDSGDPPLNPPYEQDLVVDGSFESFDMEGWEVEGSCRRLSVEGALLPVEGSAFLAGIQGNEPIDCDVRQQLDLSELGFDLEAVDAGLVAVDLEAWLASTGPAEDFDDPILLRVRYLDGTDASLGSLETLMGGAGAWVLRGATGLLPPGTRRLSVELQSRFRNPPDNNAYADDVRLWLRPVTPADPNLTLAPLLQDYRMDAMSLAWETDGNLALHGVLYGPSEDAPTRYQGAVRTIAVDEEHYVHIAELDGLSADTDYAYRVWSGATSDALYDFRTAPPAEADHLRMAWLADNQEGYSRFRIHLDHLSARDPDLLFVAGDLVATSTRLEEWREWWWGPLVDVNDFGSTTPVLVARGNHDLHHPYAYAYVQVPGNGVFYSFRYGPVFVVALDSQILPAHRPESIDQKVFLRAALESDEARSAAYRIVTFHNGPFSNITGNGSSGWEDGRREWVPVFEELDVDLVVTGHYHSYQRGSLNGVTYVTVGGGGSSLLQDVWDNWDWMTVAEMTWMYSMMEVEGETLRWDTYDLDDNLIDSFTLGPGDDPE